MATIKKFTPIAAPSIDEMLKFFSENYTPLKGEVVVNVPSEEELEKVATTKSGLFKGGSAKEDYLYTVLAKGSDVDELEVGDKVIIHTNQMPSLCVNGYVVAQVSKFTIKGKMKK